MLAEASPNDLKQVLKAYRHKVEARKATKFGAERHSPSEATAASREVFAGERASEQTRSSPFSESEGLLRSGRCGSLPAPQLGTGEVQPRFSPLLDLNTPASPISNARPYILNASLSEPGAGGGAASPQPVLKEPTNSQRPVQASPKGQGTGFAQYQDKLPLPSLFPRDEWVTRDQAAVKGSHSAIGPEQHTETARHTVCSGTTQTQMQWAQSHVDRAAFARGQTLAARPTLPLPRASGVAPCTVEEDRVLRRLQQVRAATVRCDEELRELAQESESENGTKVGATAKELDLHQVEQELVECKKRVARLEQLNKLNAGSWGAEEAPSDASTSASLGLDETWQQRAEVLRDELLRQSAIATELQDRIHWLRAQLRRQPGLQDKRMQEIVVLLVELAEMLPKDERVIAIGEILAEIANQATYAEAV